MGCLSRAGWKTWWPVQAGQASLIFHQSMQCSRPACTWRTLPTSEKMALAQLFALLSLYQPPSPVQSTVLQGGNQIFIYHSFYWDLLLCCGWGQIGNQRGFETLCKYQSSKKPRPDWEGRDKRATSAFPRSWRPEPMSHRQDEEYSLQGGQFLIFRWFHKAHYFVRFTSFINDQYKWQYHPLVSLVCTCWSIPTSLAWMSSSSYSLITFSLNRVKGLQDQLWMTITAKRVVWPNCVSLSTSPF